jgi:3-oxoacyl-[acyl-carrier protein] reductase
MDLGIRGKSALILGASKGLGFAVAKELAAEGAKIAICARDETRIRKAADAIGATALIADLGQPGAERAWSGAIASLGAVDILVINTGGPPTMPFERISPDDWRNSFEDCS